MNKTYCSKKCKLEAQANGTHISDEAIKKLSKLHTGDQNPAKRPEVRLKISQSKLGLPAWNRGLGKGFVFSGGYKMIKKRDHPRAWANGYVYEHILVLEKKLGRPLEPHEVSHHLDGNQLNNSPNNLIVMLHSAHSSLHRLVTAPKSVHRCKAKHIPNL